VGGNFGPQVDDVAPDIMTMARARTIGAVPMGAVAVRGEIYETVTGAVAEGGIEFFHGYTYSGHPAACAAGLAMMDIIEEEGLFDRARDLIPTFEEAVLSLRDHPLVRDIRIAGLIAGIELHSDGTPGKRGNALQAATFWNGVHVKFTGDTALVAPQFIATPAEIDEIVTRLRTSFDAAA